MKTKIVFLQKLPFLFCLMILFACNSKIYSQIIYTDIPDATPNATFTLDLNNDLVDDFSIYFGATDKVMCSPSNDNAYAGNFVGGMYLPWAIAQSNSICDTLSTWFDGSNPGTLAIGLGTGYWAGQTDKYLALKLIVGTNTYYGWVRLDMSGASTSFTVKDYAYESSPNTCIQAGQTALSIDENTSRSGFSVYPNPVIPFATIQTKDNLKNATLTICNSNGQTVKQIHNLSGQTFSVSRDNLPGGVYFIRITDENTFIGEEKLIITD
ncbi:MAG: T9SS type A sorting domain-containing protein [Bacteroidia bacterium]|nr:T9SS type A sorting domain-containing protein [Bacteroidia bacterium]